MNLHQQRLVDARHLTAAQTCQAHAVFVGPTVYDPAAAGEPEAAIMLSEAQQFAEWKRQDLAQYYREIRRKDCS